MLAESFGDLSFRFRRRDPNRGCLQAIGARFCVAPLERMDMEKTAESCAVRHCSREGDTHGKNKWAILFTVLIMTFMSCLDSTVVTVALPVMQKRSWAWASIAFSW